VSLVILVGVLADVPSTVELADGTGLRAVDLRTADGPIPLVWPTGTDPGDTEPGVEVVVVGRVRKRFFRAGGRTVGVTEVVVGSVVRRRRRRVVDRVVTTAVERTIGQLTSG
jgi:single-strand DNA-binding protein